MQRIILLGCGLMMFVILNTYAASNEAMEMMSMQSSMQGQRIPPMKPLFAWRDPAIEISKPPATVGKQMGQVVTLNISPMGYETVDGVKVFYLIAQPVERVLTEGKLEHIEELEQFRKNDWAGMMHHGFKQTAKLWGFNGQVPGPTIECIEGDRVRIIVKNELPEPTTIHWHGLEVPNNMDGGGDYTQMPILPGETMTYEFTLHQIGTYMYHSGYNMMKQEAMGLGGFFVIHPKDGYKHKLDHDFAIMLQQYAFHTGNDIPDVVSMDFNWFTFNGKVAPDIDYLQVKKGDRVRIRFANLSMDNHPIHLHGHNWMVVGTEGGPIAESAQWPGNTVDVAPGTTRDVEFIANNPGWWHFHCHKAHHVMNSHAPIPLGVMPMGGMFTLLHVSDTAKEKVTAKEQQPNTDTRKKPEVDSDTIHHHSTM